MALPAPLLAFFGMGDQEMILVLVIVLILFGGKQMPQLAKGMGKVLREFRKATGEVEREFKRVMEEAERETVQPFKDAMKTPDGAIPANPLHAVTEAANSAVAAAMAPLDSHERIEEDATPEIPAPEEAAPAPPPPSPSLPAGSHRLQPNSDQEFHSDI